MIKIRMMPHGVEVSGHAGAAPKGQDIVCAGVSALVMSLYRSLDEDGILSTADIRDGYALLTSTDRRCKYLIMAEYGFKMLSEQYPEYIDYFSVRLGRKSE
jgi:uncharacterized protein YsxB (DUF464 family)